MELARLGEIRSILPSGVNVMALTATATTALRTTVMKILSMKQPAVVSVSPDKNNIKYVVAPFESIEESFAPIATKLAKETVHMGRMIIFCSKLDRVANLYLFFKRQLGKNFVYPSDAPDLSRFRLVDMYTSCTEVGVQNQIIKSFTSATAPLRLVIASITFWMLIDCSDIREIIFLGHPDDIESYLRITEAAGRDGLPACALLLHRKPRRPIDQAMVDYIQNTTICRRIALFKDFDDYVYPSIASKCMCCDVCSALCGCKECDRKNHPFFIP